MQLQTESILSGYSEDEKAAYLGALAALATADREAEQEELQHLRDIAHAAGISPDKEQEVLHAAKDVSGEDLKRCLDVLKTSQLRYSLITDLIAVAKADEDYTEGEKDNIEKVARYLNVNQNQFSVLDQFVTKAADSERSPQEVTKPDFIQSLGMKDQFSNAGMNLGSMGKSIFGFLGPMLLGGIAARALGGRRGAGGLGGALGGGLGGALGGMLGGNRTMPGGGSMGLPGGFGGAGGLGGGLGSLLSGLNRSRNSRGMGGMLGNLFR